jgi:hydrogenase nickel incorporation protein HypA/HybF
MHEWALAEAVLDAAEKAAKDGGIRAVTEVVVRVGELQRMELEAFRFSLEEIQKAGRPLLAGASFRVETEPALFSCKACGRQWALKDSKALSDADEAEHIHFIPEMAHVYMRCPGCGGPDFEVAKGRGVLVAQVSGEE